jgi:ATP-dependent Clp protease protease subunit
MTRYAEDGENEPKDTGSPRLDSQLLESRTIIIGEEVSDILYRKVATQLSILERKDTKKPITVLVNSPGGAADVGFAIFDLFRFSAAPIRTVANGLVASAAVLIFLGAPQGKRLSLPNSRFLLHQPSTVTRGQTTDIEIAARQIVALKNRYNQIVADATGKPFAKIENDSDRDFWLTATDAKEYGLVNRVIEKHSELDD